MKKRIISISLSSLFLALSMGGAVQAQTDLQQVQQMMQRLGLGQSQQQQQQQQAQRPMQAAMTEQALAQQLAAWAPAGGPFAVERFRDGFSIDRQRMLDPEGRIVQFNVDPASGDATYMVEMQPNLYTLKMMRHRTGMPVTIGTASRQFGNWSIETVTGVRVAGSRLNMNARGFAVARDNALFRYTAGEGLRSYGLPETHTLAAHQNGDVSATGWLLLEKRVDTKQKEGGIFGGTAIGDLIGAVKGLGAVVGLNSADSDFALYQLETGKTVALAISLEDKKTNVLSQCRAKNNWVQQCDRLDMVESLYGQDGSPNRMHYYWRVSWYPTQTGPIAVVMENNYGKIQAVDLNSDRRAVVFERALGIAGWSSAQTPDGRVRVNAQLGFEKVVNEDVAQLLAAPILSNATSTAGMPGAVGSTTN